MTTRRLACALLTVATALAVSACGAGRDAMTYQERNNAESSNAAAGTLALRNILVEEPRKEQGYEVGDAATVVMTITNSGEEPDRLVAVTSSAAREVAVVSLGEEELEVPGFGSGGVEVTLELRGLSRPLRAGEYVDLSFRFANNGSVEVLAPVGSGDDPADRPVYTGERFEGGEEPALQGPAGGESEGEAVEGADD